MALTLRSVKGSKLTHQEMDDNWSGLSDGSLWASAVSATATVLTVATLALGASSDVKLERDAANIFAQRNSTSAQALRIYNTFTDSSNYERFEIAWESNQMN